MAAENEWDRFECPRCDRPLDEGVIERIAQLSRTVPVGIVGDMSPENWWTLSCGHCVGLIVDRKSEDRFSFKLVDHSD